MSITVNQIVQAVGGGIANGKIYTVRDLWGHKDLGEWTAGTYTTPGEVPVHDVFMVRLSPKPSNSPVVPVSITQSKNGILFEIDNTIIISQHDSKPVSVTMVDLKGAAIVKQQNIIDGKYSINTSLIPRGIYYIKAWSERESVVNKVVLR